MPSQLLRAADHRAIARLSHECRDLGDDPIVWRNHMMEQLSRLASTDLVILVEMDGLFAGEPHGTGFVECGWERGFNRQGWAVGSQLFASNPFYCSPMNVFFQRLSTTAGATFARKDLLPDEDWDRASEREPVFNTMGVDHHLYSFHALPEAPSQHAGLFCFRGLGDRDFSARQKAIVNETQRLLVPLVGRSLARFQEPSASDLSRRVQQVLHCLLDGDSDKQIAKRLRISGHTVNQYTKTIYAHFGVRGRAELLARWVRRGWGRGFDPPDGR